MKGKWCKYYYKITTDSTCHKINNSWKKNRANIVTRLQAIVLVIRLTTNGRKNDANIVTTLQGIVQVKRLKAHERKIVPVVLQDHKEKYKLKH